MKKVALFIFLTFAAAACSKPDESRETYYNPIVKPENENRILDLSYGNDPAQKMDLYLPAGRQTDKTKVFIVIHGGGWYTGDKVDVENQVFLLRNTFPDCAIANINYRLATAESLGFPKQINDLQQAVSYLNAKYTDYHIGRQYAMLGVSAGAHLAMLYGYKYNLGNQVKAICSIVGPADFSDPNYEESPLFRRGINYFVGDYEHYSENPALYNATSPVKQINAFAPKTVMFYGNDDPLVPDTQSELLKSKLDQYHIYNEAYHYDAGHADWSEQQLNDINLKTTEFFRAHFE
jgi:acetyl esterase/lipase